MTVELIKVLSLKKVYKQGKKSVTAIENISLDVRRGEILGFLGHNGAGKSTTIKIMVGLIKPTEGKVIINGIDSKESRSRKSLGFLPENYSFIDTIKGKELLLFSAAMHGMDEKDGEKRADELISLFSLEDAAEREIRKYSKGMLQKIGFASAIIHDPDILILDEPMSGLDPIGRYQFKKIFRELRDKGKTIFFSSHIVPDMEDLCDRVAIIKRGRLLKVLERHEIRDLEEIFVKMTSDLGYADKPTKGSEVH